MTTTKEAKVRIYQLAKDLDVETSVLLDICNDAGFDKVRSQLSSVDNDQIEIIKKELRKRAAPPPPIAPPPSPVLRQPLTARPPTLKAPSRSGVPQEDTVVDEPIAFVEAPPEAKSAPVEDPAAPFAPPPKSLLPVDFKSRIKDLNQMRPITPRHPAPPRPAPPAAAPPAPAAPTVPAAPVAAAPAVVAPPATPHAIPARPTPVTSPVTATPKPPARNPGRPVSPMRSLPATGQGPAGSGSSRPMERRSAVDRARPSTPYVVPPHQQRRKVVMPGAHPVAPSSQPGVVKPLVKITPEMTAGINLNKGPVSAKDILRKIEQNQQVERDKVRRETAPEGVEEDEERRGLATGVGSLVKGREERHKKRSARAKAREDDVRKLTALLDDDDTPAPTRLHRLRQHRQGTLPRKGTTLSIHTPITVRSLSEDLGIKSNELIKKLMARGQMATINSSLEELTAEELALEMGLDVKIVKEADAEEQALTQFLQPTDEAKQVHRPPVVTVMGHVDHGKTSLLDRIRESNVVDTEAGGITQHIRAWKVEHGDKAITFLDTPGHAAFTQMRARGANVTDIVVLVVAADDGIMPQTDEAISHAKAAGVPIIVAINKVDLPNANITKARQQLYSKELIPDDMGGDTPFIETVATKDRARGITELLDMILLVAEMKDLKADPERPASGTCLESRINGDEGVVANFLVQDGTLRRGDTVLAGATFGRVRQMFDDHNRPMEEAGPSTPVRVIGMDEPPEASDKFYALDDIGQAREVAADRKQKQREAQTIRRPTFRLEDLSKAVVIDVKLIIKADVKGSLEAIKKELEKLHHDEVKLKILHTAVGGITESDIQLALASPEDTLVVGFNVVPDDDARRLADEKGIELRLYDIIYKLSDDLKSALEGKLKPREEVVHLGRAVIRDIFKISRVGTIAGCHVTSGTIERSARIRLIRDGVVIYPPVDRTATLESLKRHKDDVREVREGYECGMKIAGFDDVKVGDVIEAFRVEQVQRTLS